MKKTLGENIRDARKKKGWSLKELNRRSGVSYQYLSRIENNAANPTLFVLSKIKNAIGKSIPGIPAGA